MKKKIMFTDLLCPLISFLLRDPESNGSIPSTDPLIVHIDPPGQTLELLQIQLI